MRVRWPRFGLRTRVALAVIMVTSTATAAMAFAAYKLQESAELDRLSASAELAFGQDFGVAWTIFQRADPDWPARITEQMDWQQLNWALVQRPPGKPFSIVLDAHQVDPQPPSVPVAPVSAAQLRETLAAAQDQVLTPPPGPGAIFSRVSVDPSTGKRMLIVAGFMFGSDYYLVEMLDLSVLDTNLASLQRKLAYIALGVGVLGVAAALLIALRVRRPILRVATAAKQLSAGSLGVRVPVRGRDELADLATSFNAMADRIGVSIAELRAKDRQQQRFVTDIAHDLRTPLASMVATVDSLDDANPATRDRATELLRTQTRRIARLVDDLLEIAKFDAGKAELQAERVDLRAVAADAVDLSAPDAAVDIVATGDVTIVADPRRVHTILCNLLTNAVEHGGVPITVTLDGAEPDAVTMRVADSGAGVPEELLPILFDRFARGDRARRPTAGSGLGLSIARENALFHGGNLIVHNAHGAVFTLLLPRRAQADGIRNSD